MTVLQAIRAAIESGRLKEPFSADEMAALLEECRASCGEIEGDAGRESRRGPAGAAPAVGPGSPAGATPNESESGGGMEELRELAKGPAAIFGRFLGELQRLASEGIPADRRAIERLQDLRAARVREIEEALQRFRDRAGEVEATLGGLLHPPPPSLFEEIGRTLQRLRQLMERAARRDALLRTWEDGPADALVEGYRAALERHERETAELYEAEAERVLRRKGDGPALQALLLLRAQALEGRRSPAQRQVQAHLEEIERLKRDVGLASLVIASTLNVPKTLAALGASWRRRNRLHLACEEQGRTSVAILAGPHPAMTASVVDVSRTGLRLAVPARVAPGTVLHFIVKCAGSTDDAFLMQGEACWCRPDGGVPGRFLMGVRLVLDGGGYWVALLKRLVERQQKDAPLLEPPVP